VDTYQLVTCTTKYAVLFLALIFLDAQRQLLLIQDQLAQSETETGLALVALYKALGGGWEENAVTEVNQD
jgi:outer membrane protein TolC